MKYLKKFKQINEEESKWKSFLLSAALSIGLSYADAQTIESDSSKIEIIENISNFNKNLMNDNYTNNYENLKIELSKKLTEPEIFIKRYLTLQPDGTLIVRPDVIEGLEFHLRRNFFEFGYNIKF